MSGLRLGVCKINFPPKNATYNRFLLLHDAFFTDVTYTLERFMVQKIQYSYLGIFEEVFECV